MGTDFAKQTAFNVLQELDRAGKCLAAIKCNGSDGRDDSELTTYAIHVYLDGIFSQTKG